MAWIESHQELRNHPKVFALAAMLNGDPAHIVGHLHCLWWWCMDYAVDGNVTKYSPTQIAYAAGWKADPEAFHEALMQCGWIDRENGGRWIHDWLDFCGEIVKKRIERKAEKKQKTNDIKRQTAESVGKTAEFSAELPPTVPYLTVPNQTIKTNTNQASPVAEPEFGVSALMNLWNSKAHQNLPKVQILNKSRETHAKARLLAFPDPAFWTNIIQKINDSQFLTGQSTSWKCDFDWILNPSNLTKILEGNYDNSRSNNGSKSNFAKNR